MVDIIHGMVIVIWIDSKIHVKVVFKSIHIHFKVVKRMDFREVVLDFYKKNNYL